MVRYAVAIASIWLGLIGAAHAACKIDMDGQFPLEPDPTRALIKGSVNGHPSVFIVDTGSSNNLMPVADAHRLGVRMDASRALIAAGIGGERITGVGHVNVNIGGLALRDEAFTVTDMDALDHQAVALIGRSLLDQHDLELDLPDNAIRILEPKGCSAAELPYWDKPYSQVQLHFDGSSWPPILVDVLLNGHLVEATIDSGASQSIVTPAVVRGTKASSDQPIEDIKGIGPRHVSAQVARFDTFTIGDETIRNAKIAISDMWKYNKTGETGTRLGSTTADLWEPQMLLGADFLRAHRVIVSYSLGVVVFSYMGGPVFDISSRESHASSSGSGLAPPQ